MTDKSDTQKIKICIVTPGALGSNPRVVKEADALYSAGYDVTVVSTRTMKQIDELDATILAKVNWKAKRVDLRTRRSRLPGRLVQSLARVLSRIISARMFVDFAFSGRTMALSRALKPVRAILYIAHYPAALPAAARAARKNNARYAFDAEDFHPGDLDDSPIHAQTNRLLSSIESHYLPHAAYVTAAAPLIAKAYAEQYSLDRPTTVLNTFPVAQAARDATACGTVSPGPSLYWFSQTIGPGRGLETAIEAIGKARSQPHLYLRGLVHSDYRAHLLTLAKRCACKDRLHFLKLANPADLSNIAAGFDVGLASEVGNTQNHQIALANKVFTYLLGGVPVLLSNTPAHRHIAESFGGAAQLFTVDDAQSLASGLDEWLLNPAALHCAREHAFRLGQKKFNWETDAKSLLACVRAALVQE